MAKRSRSRSHTKRRKSRRGGAWYNPMTWGQSDSASTPAQPTVAEQIAPAASVPLDAAASAAPPVADAMTPPGVAPEAPGMTPTGGRSRRRRGGSRKTKRRRGGKYY